MPSADRPSPDDLLEVDRALRRMRHLLDPPGDVGDHGVRVETSTVLVLEAVLDAGARTVREVADHLDVAHSTASRLVTRAEQAGMVRRAPSPASGRETLVVATDDGVALRERGLRFRLERLTDLTGGWPADDVEAFARLLTRFAGAAVAAQETAPPTSRASAASQRGGSGSASQPSGGR